MSVAPPTCAFLDTTDFIEFRDFTELPWREIVEGASAVRLVVPWQVMVELNKNKDSNKSRTKRERARRVLADLERLADLEPGTEFQPGVTIEFCTVNPAEAFKQYDLDPTDPDLRSLAEMLAFRDANPKLPLVVVTDDGPMRIRARRLLLKVLAMSADQRLADEPDPEEKERRELQREVQRNAARRPELTVRFPGGANHYKVQLERFRPSSPEAITLMVEKEMAKHPRRVERFPAIEGVNTDFARWSIGNDAARYNEQRELYRAAFESHVSSLETHRNEIARTIELALEVENTSTVMADYVMLDLHFPPGLQVRFEPPEPPAPPAAPNPPAGPLDPLQLPHLPNLSAMIAARDEAAELLAARNVQPPEMVSDTAEGGAHIRFRIRRLHHRSAERLDTLYVTLPSGQQPKPFAVSFSASAELLANPFDGVVHVVIGHAATHGGGAPTDPPPEPQ